MEEVTPKSCSLNPMCMHVCAKTKTHTHTHTDEKGREDDSCRGCRLTSQHRHSGSVCDTMPLLQTTFNKTTSKYFKIHII